MLLALILMMLSTVFVTWDLVGMGLSAQVMKNTKDYHQVGNAASFVLTGAMCMISKIIRNVIKDAMCCGLIYGVHFLIKCCGCKQ